MLLAYAPALSSCFDTMTIPLSRTSISDAASIPQTSSSDIMRPTVQNPSAYVRIVRGNPRARTFLDLLSAISIRPCLMAYLKKSSRSAYSFATSCDRFSISAAFRSTTVLSRRTDSTSGARSDMVGLNCSYHAALYKSLWRIPDSLM